MTTSLGDVPILEGYRRPASSADGLRPRPHGSHPCPTSGLWPRHLPDNQVGCERPAPTCLLSLQATHSTATHVTLSQRLEINSYSIEEPPRVGVVFRLIKMQVELQPRPRLGSSSGWALLPWRVQGRAGGKRRALSGESCLPSPTAQPPRPPAEGRLQASTLLSLGKFSV